MHTLTKLALAVQTMTPFELTEAVRIESELQTIWNDCADDMALREWLYTAGVPGATWLKCCEICSVAPCEQCVDAIRRRHPVPPTIAELMAARAR